MLICGALAMVTLSLKRAGIPLYLDKEGSGDNMVNRLLWNLLLGAPLMAMLAAAIGYLATSQALLAGWKPRSPSGSCCWWSITSSAAGC
jgi:potassium efflux system protein